MTKRFTKPFIAMLILLCLVFVSSVIGAFAIGNVNAETADEGGAVVALSDAADFDINNNVLSGLSDSGKAKIADASAYSVVVPESVTEITEGAFAGLSKMTSLTIPFVGKSAAATGEEGVLSYIFGKNAYIGAARTEQVYASSEMADGATYQPSFKLGNTYAGYLPIVLREVTVTGGTLGHGAFSNCAYIRKVTLSNIATVGDLAFYYSGLYEIDLGDVTVINRRAFQDTTHLQEIDLTSVTSIGRFAFSESGLVSVELPSALGNNLGYYAFSTCPYLVKVKVNSGVQITMGNSGSAFVYSNRIREVVDLREEGAGVDKSVEFWKGSFVPKDNFKLSTDEDFVSDIIDVDGYVFHKTETVCSFVEYVGEDKALVLPDAEALQDYGITQYAIADYAFYNSDAGRTFVTVSIPSCVTSIGASAFLESGIIKITIGEEREDGVYPEIAYIYNVTFWGCTTLREVFIYSSYNANPLFGYTDYVDYDYDKGQWIIDFIYLDNVNLYNAAKDEQEPESNVKQIGDFVFNIDRNKNVELVAYVGNGGIISLPTAEQVVNAYPQTDGTYVIGESVFAQSIDITGVVIPDAVTEIGAFAFNDCPVLVNVSIEGNNLKKIGAEAFKQSGSLANISIPDSVTHIGTAAFRDCSSLTSVNLPVSLTTWGTEKLVGGLDRDRGYVFNNCVNLTSITIPAGVTNVPYNSFGGCSALTSLTFAEGSKVETIGPNAFAGASLTTVVLPASVNYVDLLAFGGTSTIKQLYIESDDVVFNNSFSLNSVRFESVYIANASDTLNLSQTFLFDSNGSTVFLPENASASLVNALQNAAILVVPDKATYDALMGSSNITSGIKNKLYWQTEVTFTVTDTLGNVYTEKQAKLASNSGASIKYVLTNDAAGRPYRWAVNNSYSLPSTVGGNIVDAAAWQDDSGNALTSDAKIGADNLTYTMADAVEAKITTPSDKRIEYTGEEFAITETTLTFVRATDKTGRAVTPVDVGEYLIYVKPIDGVVWENGGTEERMFALEIYKTSAALQWYYNLNTTIDSNGVFEVTYFDELIADLFTAKCGDITLRINNGISATIDGQSFDVDVSLMSEQVYRFTASHKNYEFTNAEIMVRVNPIAIDLGANLNWSASNSDSSLVISSGSIYIGTANGNTVMHSLPHPSITYTEVRDVIDSIVRYTGEQTTLTLAASNYYTFNITGNVGIASDVYTASVTLQASPNYKFTTNLTNDFADRGITVTIEEDGKTAVVTKTWYILEMENELLDNAASIAAGKWVEYTIVGWTYGQTVNIEAPRLVHGDELGDWQSNKNVTFELRRGSEIIASGISRDQFKQYVNSSMPAGNYLLVATVNAITMDGAHTHWWNGETHTSADTGLLVQEFERRYSFTVAAANIVIDTDKITVNANGYAEYDWEIASNVNKATIFDNFVAAINAQDVVKLTYVEREGFWAKDEAAKYFGEHELTYNLSQMNNETYLEASDNNLLEYIDVDTPVTYTVYFQITALNHNNLTNTHVDGRYAYYFTVTAFKKLDTPAVNDQGLVYNGNKVLPTITESALYETIWDADDTYVAGGQHSVSFKLYDDIHYRWADLQTDTVSVNFTIGKADNAWVRVPNIVSWTYYLFDAQVNRIRAVVKFLDDGEQIAFSITKADGTAVEGLSGFAVNDAGIINDEALITALTNLKVGDYKLVVTVDGTNNYNPINASIDFAIGRSTNSWSITPNVMQWKYNDYDKNVNLILGAAKIQDATNPVMFKVTADKSGATEIIASFALVDGIVPNDVANKLAKLEVGSYYLWASVAETDSYSRLQPDEPFEFAVSQAINDWKVPFDVIGWAYKGYDKDTNRIMGSVINGTVTFAVLKDGVAIEGLEGFTEVTDEIAGILKLLDAYTYKVTATVKADDNYMPVAMGETTLTVAKAINTWADGEGDLVLPSWIVGQFNLEENEIAVNAAYGQAVIEIKDIDGNTYYSSLNPEENTLNELEVGKYLLVARVPGGDNYIELGERTFTIEVLPKTGWPWWVTLIVTVGSLGLAVAVFFILWKLKVFEILTDKISLAITTRATVDATIAAVRATKKAEEAEAHKRKVEARERLEAAREAYRNKTPEERAQALQERAEATATKANEMHAKADKMRARADKLTGNNEQPEEEPSTEEENKE